MSSNVGLDATPSTLTIGGVTQENTKDTPFGNHGVTDTGYLKNDSGLFEPVVAGDNTEVQSEVAQICDDIYVDDEEADQIQLQGNMCIQILYFNLLYVIFIVNNFFCARRWVRVISRGCQRD
uniref:Uncharacterized protein n=1 Tax=Leersia perrieri TaxID=77586 RepID=A0A0D9WNX4_9ORYZ